MLPLLSRYSVPASSAKCSAIGPSASAGAKKVRPPTIRIEPTSRPTNNPPWVENVPADAAALRLAASEPATAESMGTIHGEAAEHHGDAERGVPGAELAERPAKALPLFPAAEVKA